MPATLGRTFGTGYLMAAGIGGYVMEGFVAVVTGVDRASAQARQSSWPARAPGGHQRRHTDGLADTEHRQLRPARYLRRTGLEGT